MSFAVACVLLLPALVLLGFALVPTGLANARVEWLRRTITWISGLQFVSAFLLTSLFVTGASPVIAEQLLSADHLPFAVSVYFDGVSSLMLTLVSFVGWVICGYSARYLDGEATQGRYFRWTAFTIGAVSIMVISGNLLMFVAAWILTSLGLHQLLTHYGHRPAAQRSAWTKFAISRLGDVSLIAALVLIYRQFNTFDFAELFAAAESMESVTTSLGVAGFLLVVGAITKSAQFPFHTWLPLTMETPTPVSALMHAGIVNAGGYLMIRTSPLVALAPWALTFLAIVGGFTACFAAVVMLTQTSVKKSLAYSTIAQMGFMMLQCGLGAFSAAMLHIIAHSLYKAHAFLSSGTLFPGEQVPDPRLNAHRVDAHRVDAHRVDAQAFGRLITSWGIAGISTLGILSLSFAAFGVDPIVKPGGLLLGGVICLALTYWVAQVYQAGNAKLWVQAMIVAGALCTAYTCSFVAVDQVISASIPSSNTAQIPWAVSGIILVGFLAVFGLQATVTGKSQAKWISKWHVHASNGFYMESIVRRLLAPIRHLNANG
ncbi:proton-conducting transporter transmembrane domain-containing protein [Stieleria varia]|uniref:Probable inorganic carbon transporter subunit DabB n=1 Tax=Stieleria varia TaxID=2528005 RepID=A0A5C6AZ96_9BACT|nr:proton-conducting transporter membrane subunit [Stieleria varia]TWU04452.1 NADH-quinone oxidoreductase subunit L [Stieleria varia]